MITKNEFSIKSNHTFEKKIIHKMTLPLITYAGENLNGMVMLRTGRNYTISNTTMPNGGGALKLTELLTTCEARQYRHEYQITRKIDDITRIMNNWTNSAPNRR